MALDKALVLSQNTKQAAPKDAVTARRNRLINRIHNQLEYLQREKEGQLPQRAYRRLARWWWQEGKGYYQVVRSGPTSQKLGTVTSSGYAEICVGHFIMKKLGSIITAI